MADEPDFITLMPTVDNQRALVVVMRYNRHDDSYTMGKCSDALSVRAARQLAERWAEDMHLEVR